ncbi:hypothetical protein EON62_05065, partial [archaeon]
SGGLHGGHYTAHAYNTKTRRWYSFNDSYAREARESDAVDSSAYVLFYRRRTDVAEVATPTPEVDAEAATGAGARAAPAAIGLGSRLPEDADMDMDGMN